MTKCKGKKIPNVGRQIRSLKELALAVHRREAVFSPDDATWSVARPAAFLIHQSAAKVHELILHGLFVYVAGGRR